MNKSAKTIPRDTEECANSLLIVSLLEITIPNGLIDKTYFVMRMALCFGHGARTK